ncbi:MAG: sulfotransferase [Rikenellaceae bacterium]
MKFDFDKIPISTLVGASWSTFNKVAKGQVVDKEYRTKFHLTRALCWLLSATHPIERAIYRKRVEPKESTCDPLFVLGHWRSGTTFVHNLLSCDKRFGYTTTYQTVFPNAMLFGQSLFKGTMQKVMPDKRPVDGLELRPDLPQEEEFALSAMMPYSYYNFWMFPQSMMEYADKYLLMNNLTTEQREQFDENFKKLVKLSLHNTGGERYLSKNPPHTGRVKELLEIFPNAKFIYLMRNPYTVFESTRSFFTGTIKPLQFQKISDEQLTENFVDIYARLYDKYQSDKELIPEGNLIEMKFEDFEVDPVAQMKRIYDTLSLEGFEEALPAIKEYVGEKRSHKKNKYKYAPETVEIVEKRWGKALSDWGYELAK